MTTDHTKDEAFEAMALVQWDKWRKAIAEGCIDSWPRDEFEALLEAHRDAVEAPLLAEIERLNKWADGFSNAQIKERQTGEIYQRELRAELSAAQERIRELEAANATLSAATSCDQIKLAHRVGELEAELSAAQEKIKALLGHQSAAVHARYQRDKEIPLVEGNRKVKKS